MPTEQLTDWEWLPGEPSNGLDDLKAQLLFLDKTCLLKGGVPYKRNLHFQENKFGSAIYQASWVMKPSPYPVNGAQDLHENLHYIGDAAFLGY